MPICLTCSHRQQHAQGQPHQQGGSLGLPADPSIDQRRHVCDSQIVRQHCLWPGWASHALVLRTGGSHHIVWSPPVQSGARGQGWRQFAHLACDLLSPAPAGLPCAAWPAFGDWPGVFAFSELTGVTSPPAALFCMTAWSSNPQCPPEEMSCPATEGTLSHHVKCQRAEARPLSRRLARYPPIAQGN